jgi:hypothetical protein
MNFKKKQLSNNVLRSPLAVFLFSLVVALISSGCGWFGEEEEESFDEAFPELSSMMGNDAEQPEEQLAEASSLSLNLNVGDRFPLIKTVEQELTQSSTKGIQKTQSKLEMSLAISVEEIRGDQIRLAVRYDRVRYWQDILGEILSYDSDKPEANIPLSLMPYQGMVQNGFSFWLGPSHEVVELVGFNDFLTRCLEKVPPQQRQAVMTSLAANQAEEGIANFIDDSIGLLPKKFDDQGQANQIQVGSTWQKQRQVVRPLPMMLSDKCLLKELTDDIAQIEIVGSVAPGITYGPSNQQNSKFNMRIKGGHSFGNCTIDRKTGLPLNSHVERYFDMVVQVAPGIEFEQRKRIVTTIRAFPQQGAPAVQNISSQETAPAGNFATSPTTNGGVQQSNFQTIGR